MFKRKVKIEYVPSQPRYQALGNMEGCLYFINSDSGNVFVISKNFSDGMPGISKLMTLRD